MQVHELFVGFAGLSSIVLAIYALFNYTGSDILMRLLILSGMTSGLHALVFFWTIYQKEKEEKNGT